jgi:hypothetical protein
MLPNDEQGRHWVQAQWTGNSVPQEKEILATLVTTGEDDEILILGSAFIIRGNGDSAICLGAAHSFSEVKKLQRMRRANGHFNVPADFRARGPEYVAPDGIRAIFVVDRKLINCRIDQLNYIENYDVVVFTVYAPEARQVFTSHIAIDLGAPRVGEEIAILANDITVEKRSINGIDGHVVGQRFEARLGIVTEVVMGPSAIPGQSFVFRTTIPATPGMSGAPVVNKPIAGQTIIARGVVSSDVSNPEAFTSFLIPGRSTATMLWPAMGLALNAKIPPDVNGHVFLADLLHKKLFDDRSGGVKVHVQQPANMTEILYVDERTNPPTRGQLSMTGHPNIKQ